MVDLKVLRCSTVLTPPTILSRECAGTVVGRFLRLVADAVAFIEFGS